MKASIPQALIITPLSDAKSWTGMILGILGLACYGYFADWTSPWFYFAGLGGKPIISGLAGCGLLGFLLLYQKPGNRAAEVTLWVLAVIYWLRCLHAARETLKAGVLYKTDHPSFMFRLHEFASGFPDLGGYNPVWNGGVEHFTGVSSGVQGIGLVFLPLLKIFPVHEIYNPLVLTLFLVLVPLITVASVRAVGGCGLAMAAGGLFCLGISHSFFLWMWHFGTLGAAFSSAMVLPVLALSYRVAVLQSRTVWTFLGLWLSVLLMCMWMPMALGAGTGLLISYLLSWKQWDRKSFFFLAACATVFLISWSPWLRIVLFPARGVVTYIGQPAPGSGISPSWLLAGWASLGRNTADSNPLILVLSFSGVCGLLPAAYRRWFFPSMAVLSFFSGWMSLVKPLSQFERLIIPGVFVLTIPASLVFARWMRHPAQWSAWLKLPALFLLMLSGEMAVRSYANQGPAPAQCLDPVVLDIADWVGESVPENGRLLFAGSAVHAYGGGKIAYLPVLTGREMMADDYFGFPRHTIEYNFPPRYYRKDPERFRRYLDWYQVTHVITAHDNFRDYFSGEPERFVYDRSFEFRGTRLSAYRYVRQKPLFPENIKIIAELNAFLIDFPPGTTEAVFPYNWREGLYPRTPDAEISPQPMDENIRFIRVKRGQSSHVELGYRLPWKPVETNFDGSFHH